MATLKEEARFGRLPFDLFALVCSLAIGSVTVGISDIPLGKMGQRG
jgi:hypothetical protein